MLLACCSAVVVLPQAFGPSIRTAPIASNLSRSSWSAIRFLYSMELYFEAKIAHFFVIQAVIEDYLEIWRKIVWKFGVYPFGNLAELHARRFPIPYP